jgi:peroxidase
MDPALVTTLKATCPQFNANTSTEVPLDTQSQFTFDNHYYKEMVAKRGVLGIDQEIVTSSTTNGTVAQMSANQTLFFQNFAASMIKMSLVGVKDATTGNIRSNCSSVVASPPPSPAFAPAPAPAFDVAPPPTAGG